MGNDFSSQEGQSTASGMQQNMQGYNQPQPDIVHVPGNSVPGFQKAQNTNSGSSATIAKIAVAAVILVVAIYVIYVHATSQLGSTNRVIAMLSTNKPVSMFAIANAMAVTVNSISKLNVTYTGSATLTLYTALTGNMSMSLPISMKYEKYYNISRASASVSGIPLVGGMDIIAIKNSSKMYTCTNQSIGGIIGTGSNQSGFKCYVVSNKTAGSANVNLTSLSKVFNVSVRGIKEVYYNKTPCYLMAGNGKASINPNAIASFENMPEQYGVGPSSPVNFTYNITGCVSMQYGIPLNMSAKIKIGNESSPMDISLLIKATGVNSDTNAQIGNLPGPVTNASSISSLGNFSTSGSTSYPTTEIASACIPFGGFMCLSFKNTSTGFNATIGEVIRHNMENFSVIYVPMFSNQTQSLESGNCSINSSEMAETSILGKSVSTGQTLNLSIKYKNPVSGMLWAFYKNGTNMECTPMASVFIANNSNFGSLPVTTQGSGIGITKGSSSSSSSGVAYKTSSNFTSCSNFTIFVPLSIPPPGPQVVEGICDWKGGMLNVTYGGGYSGWASVSLIAQNGTAIFSNSGDIYCPQYAGSIYAPAGSYTVKLMTGRGGGACGGALAQISG
ncbi:MAG: hypothetical protein ACP5FR_01840 [Candidatus Micrarchaeia archaeon]